VLTRQLLVTLKNDRIAVDAGVKKQALLETHRVASIDVAAPEFPNNSFGLQFENYDTEQNMVDTGRCTRDSTRSTYVHSRKA